MSIGKVIYNVLKDNAGVSALVGTKIYPMVAPQGTASPLVVYQRIDNDPNDTKTGTSKLDFHRVQITAWGATNTEAESLDDAIRTAIDRYEGTVSGVVVDGVQYLNTTDTYDENAEEYGKISDYYIMVKR